MHKAIKQFADFESKWNSVCEILKV
jgi:hypothetical protein